MIASELFRTSTAAGYKLETQQMKLSIPRIAPPPNE